MFSDDGNFNTGFPKATLVTPFSDSFKYKIKNVKSIAPTLTGKWAPYWESDTTGELRVRIIANSKLKIQCSYLKQIKVN